MVDSMYFTMDDVTELRKLISESKDKAKTSFTYRDHDFFVPYAEYLCEFIETKCSKD